MALADLLALLEGVAPSALAAGAAALLLLGGLAREAYAWYRLSHIPGPFMCSITGFSMARKALRGNFHQQMVDMAKTYGPLVRVGPNELMISDHDTLKRMAAPRSKYTKGYWYTTTRIVPGQDHLFSTRDDDKRRALKAKMGPGYSGKENGGLEPGIDKQLANFIALIEAKYISTPTDYRPMDLATKSQYFPLDVISELGFSEPFGFLKEDQDLWAYMRTNDDFWPVVITLGNVPELARFMRTWPLTLLMPKSTDKEGFGAVMGFANAFVDKRMAPGAEPRRDMIQAFINSGMTRGELVQEVYAEIFAGVDTVATAFRMTLLSLISTPTAFSALRREIDDAIAAGKVSSPIRHGEAQDLPYLQACIREGLRLYPPGTGLLYKQVPAEGDYIHGYWVPGGTQIGQNICGVTHDVGVFGPDADVFRPERWIEADEDRFRAMMGVAELVFGYGKFQCVGKGIAMMELNKVLVELLRRYDFSTISPEHPMKLWSAGFWITHDFYVRVSRRVDLK